MKTPNPELTIRLRLDVAYDGGPFSGWARQPDRPTVQGALEDALSVVFGVPFALTVAGRTDAGVHATGQVCHADLDRDAWVAAMAGHVIRRVNGVLPPEVRVLDMRKVPDVFDARFSALWRRYVYRVSDAEYGGLPLNRGDTVWHPRTLGLRRLQAGSKVLVGEHDFAAFCRRRDGATTIRTLRTLSWSRGSDGVYNATVVADAFCHQMVRALIATLLAVGDGRKPAEWVGQVLDSGDRQRAGGVAPAHGLTLVEVRYPADNRLAARAEQTRNRRDEPAIPA
ncbi:MAG: tRNA pseudouridine(38-40) synthase TruA [Actinomycetota bacterium]